MVQEHEIYIYCCRDCYLLGHFLEVAIGKTIKESSVSWLELGIIAPLMNGFLFDW